VTSELRAKMASDLSIAQAIIYENHLPATPDTVVALDQLPGMGGIGFLMEDLGLEQPALRVRVRGAAMDQATPEATITTIGQWLEGLGAFVASGVRYLAFTPVGSAFVMDRDGKERVVWARSFIALKEQS
jgi:hypothetical protein